MAVAISVQFGLAQQTLAPGYVPGVTYQTTNSNYPLPNPFFFEGRIDYNLLNITAPSNAWEFAQRGIHEQDDQENFAAAIADYKQSVSLNSLTSTPPTCQVVTTAWNSSGTLNPPPCMFTVRLRLAGLLREHQTPADPNGAITLYNEVLRIDPLRLGVHSAIAETWVQLAQAATGATQTTDYNNAVTEFQKELALSPVTAATTALTGDLANNAHVHYELAAVFRALGNTASEGSELNLYLKATQWHSDTYPWRITWARARLGALGIPVSVELTGEVQTVTRPGPPPSQPRPTPVRRR
jgi:tetratricopeptide (TPR) repeat protein